MKFSERKIKRISLGLFGTLMLTGLVACAGAPTPVPDGEGVDLYRARCGACHSVPHPARHTKEQWPPVLTLMERRMAEAGMPPFVEGERARILGYLERHGR
ncbi:MAG: cytochrome C [Nitrospirota bacterium]|nr:cytochrome C [Nitrospirota bacterium]